MIVNPNVDIPNKTRIHRKTLRKSQKNNNLLKMKRRLKLKYKLSGAIFLHLVCQGEQFATLPPRQLRHWPWRSSTIWRKCQTYCTHCKVSI